MKFIIITDTHFAHDKILEMGDRKKGWENKFHKRIKSVFPSITTPKADDYVLIHLGDVAFNNESGWHEYITSFCKHNIMIKGNHDKRSLSWYYKYWDTVAYSMGLNIYGKNIIFSHKPIRLFDPENQINIHGHFHIETYEKCFEVEPNLKELYTDSHIRLPFGIYNLEKIVQMIHNSKIKKFINIQLKQ